MELLLMKIGAVLKWLVPAAFGSGMALFLDKAQSETWRKVLLFIFGVCVSTFFGGGLIEYLNIQLQMVQSAIYFGTALWGIGIIVQINEQMPQLIRAGFSRLFGVDVKGKGE